MEKYVYLFQEGNKDMRNILGGKGANLAEMTNIGLPVPSGFTVTTDACNKYYEDGKELSSEVIDQIKEKRPDITNIPIHYITPAVGAHIGCGVVGICAFLLK